MWILLKKSDFENVNFLKYVILNMLIFGSNMDFCPTVLHSNGFTNQQKDWPWMSYTMMKPLKNLELSADLRSMTAACRLCTSLPHFFFCVTNCTLVTSSDVASALKPQHQKWKKASRWSRQRESKSEQKRRMNEGNKKCWEELKKP